MGRAALLQKGSRQSVDSFRLHGGVSLESSASALQGDRQILPKTDTMHPHWRPAYAIRRSREASFGRGAEPPRVARNFCFARSCLNQKRLLHSAVFPGLAWTEITSTAVGGILFLTFAGIIRGLNRIEQAIRETRATPLAGLSARAKGGRQTDETI